MIPDPSLGRILALGINPTPKPPKMSIVVDDLTITLQPDGQIALYNTVGLFACECKGQAVTKVPETATFKAGLRQEKTRIAIWQDGKEFYSKRKGKVTLLRIFDHTSPYMDREEVELDDDAPEGCSLWHTNDDSIDDYWEEVEDEEFPIPRHGQPDQTEEDD
ncbi:hypothetical protein [Nodosilinea sp. PGN35]|uniref:hypothetical protein n=1 Tax=Nodosilinea sp. PGN35 TaxID=3020489 RepID=UPI0023B2A034|nr:hypothetical protein [Nodosilinea sp. TSF1-S3]MDF0369078.1 hypothetical protein [Nodosilinea sp. TSF1-S3]